MYARPLHANCSCLKSLKSCGALADRVANYRTIVTTDLLAARPIEFSMIRPRDRPSAFVLSVPAIGGYIMFIGSS
jgi:hypothetical protein